MDTLESYGLRNHIKFPIHRLQNTLDLIITKKDSTTIMDTNQGLLFTDLNMAHFSIQSPTWMTQLKSISYRKTKVISKDLLKKDILLKIPHHSDCNSQDEHVKLYNSSLREIHSGPALSKNLMTKFLIEVKSGNGQIDIGPKNLDVA